MSAYFCAIKRWPLHTLLVLCVLLAPAVLSPSTAHATSKVSSNVSSKLCSNSAVTAFITRLAKRLNVSVPYVVELKELSRPQYQFYENTIETPRCVTKNELYHEFGHHVMAMAANSDPVKFSEFSGQFRQYKVWLKTSLDPPGFERAAHCVGYQLGGRGVFTRCPFKEARKLGSWFIGAASYFSPYGS